LLSLFVCHQVATADGVAKTVGTASSSATSKRENYIDLTKVGELEFRTFAETVSREAGVAISSEQMWSAFAASFNVKTKPSSINLEGTEIDVDDRGDHEQFSALSAVSNRRAHTNTPPLPDLPLPPATAAAAAGDGAKEISSAAHAATDLLPPPPLHAGAAGNPVADQPAKHPSAPPSLLAAAAAAAAAAATGGDDADDTAAAASAAIDGSISFQRTTDVLADDEDDESSKNEGRADEASRQCAGSVGTPPAANCLDATNISEMQPPSRSSAAATAVEAQTLSKGKFSDTSISSAKAASLDEPTDLLSCFPVISARRCRPITRRCRSNVIEW
jgi:hypothetical protein